MSTLKGELTDLVPTDLANEKTNATWMSQYLRLCFRDSTQLTRKIEKQKYRTRETSVYEKARLNLIP